MKHSHMTVQLVEMDWDESTNTRRLVSQSLVLKASCCRNLNVHRFSEPKHLVFPRPVLGFCCLKRTCICSA